MKFMTREKAYCMGGALGILCPMRHARAACHACRTREPASRNPVHHSKRSFITLELADQTMPSGDPGSPGLPALRSREGTCCWSSAAPSLVSSGISGAYGGLSAQLIVHSRPWRMTQIQTRISHVHPTAGIHQRGTLRYCGVLRAGAPTAILWRTRAPVTRSEATVERWMGAARTTRRSRRSGPVEDRAQPAEGRSRRTGGGSGPTTSIRNAGGAFTNRMTAETLRVRADIGCVIYICTWAVTTTRKWY